MHRTPWTKQVSSFPSDRIKPASKGQNNTQKSKSKGNERSPAESTKSKEVRRLEALLQSVRTASPREKDPKGGCFCLARLHGLSLYAPMCHSCGLILCSLNPPHSCCPSCREILMTDSSRESLITQLETQLALTIANEIKEAERAIEEARVAAGSFPSLLRSTSPAPLSSSQPTYPIPAKQTHKVLSLTGTNKRVVVSSYTTKTPTPSRPISRDEIVEEEPERIAAPPPEPLHANRLPTADRPFENLIKGGITYKPKLKIHDVTTNDGVRVSKSSKKKPATGRKEN